MYSNCIQINTSILTIKNKLHDCSQNETSTAPRWQRINLVSGSWSSRGASLAAAGRYGRLRSLGERLLVYISGLVGPGDVVCFGWIALLVINVPVWVESRIFSDLVVDSYRSGNLILMVRVWSWFEG